MRDIAREIVRDSGRGSEWERDRERKSGGESEC